MLKRMTDMFRQRFTEASDPRQIDPVET
jgi:hypothetical protein